MARFPILVVAYQGAQGMTLGCNACGYKRHEPDYDAFCEAAEVRPVDCPACGQRAVVPAYETADQCPNCRTLGHWSSMPFGGACSRACRLQVEYARQIGALSS